jgi:hypothetical protein
MPPTVFPIKPDAGSPTVETYAFATEILTAEDGTEQRRLLREHPVGGIDLPMVAHGRKAQTLQAYLITGSGQQWAAPLWPLACRMSADIAPGAGSIPLAESNLPFTDWQGVAPYALLWRDPWTYELLSIANDVFPDSLPLNDVVVGTWPKASTWVLPIRLGRIIDSSLEWWNVEALTGHVQFSFESTGESFYGFDGTELIETFDRKPNRTSPREQGFEHRLDVLDPGLGTRAAFTRDKATATRGRTFNWTAFSRADALELRAFLTRRLGRLVPFWVPSYQRDMQLAVAAAAIDTEIVIEAIGYAALLFPNTGARRYLRLRAPGGAFVDAKVTAAVDNEDGTETLTLDDPLGAAFGLDCLVMFRQLCRLDADEIRIEWRSPQVAQASLPVHELPNEAAL